MQSPDTNLENRNPSVAGKFYPNDPIELRQELKDYFSRTATPESASNTMAVIAPHAGYVFSGEVAAAAIKQLDPKKEYKTVFIIACSHRASFRGAAVYTKGNYLTPLGEVPVNFEIAGKLAKSDSILSFDPWYQENEHSIEVLLPFLQYYLEKPFKIVPILLGTQDPAICKAISSQLKPWFTKENAFVISTDFSHYPSYDNAIKTDNTLAEAILSNSSEKLIKTEHSVLEQKIGNLATGCCSWPAVLTLVYLSEGDNGLKYSRILYRNSGDSKYGDKDRVVGYHAIRLSLEENTKPGFKLEDNECVVLLSIARQTIQNYAEKGKMPDVPEIQLTPNLRQKAGAFVTLKKNGQLRGCIGHFEANMPLFEIVMQMAVAAAFQDHRFQPVQVEEIDDLHIDISILTPMSKIKSVDEIRLGIDGIYVKKGNRAGTFLPQVATDTGWNLDEFLGHCSRDKAGIGWDGWRDKETEIYIYQAMVIEE
ncbi:MAG: AmmeMemoRadiSam system protein B [Bacteroidales bacterium]|nr:AmmeMemoRadiSam system protein B [Bacteroidales bacterium]